MTGDAFIEWLGSVTCTKPFTLADAAELKAMIKAAVVDGKVDVYTTKGDKVHVRIETPRGVLTRDLDVV